jgi:hypothetical protein
MAPKKRKSRHERNHTRGGMPLRNGFRWSIKMLTIKYNRERRFVQEDLEKTLFAWRKKLMAVYSSLLSMSCFNV